MSGGSKEVSQLDTPQLSQAPTRFKQPHYCAVVPVHPAGGGVTAGPTFKLD